MSTGELLKSPGVTIVLYLYSHVLLLALASTAGNLQILYWPLILIN